MHLDFVKHVFLYYNSTNIKAQHHTVHTNYYKCEYLDVHLYGMD